MGGSARDERLHSEDLELAAGCARGDPGALRLFETKLLSRVPQFLSRFDASGALCDEVAQEMRAELLVPSAGKPPGISAYAGRGDLAAWLRIVAIRTALRLRKSENRPPPDGSDPLLRPGAPGPGYVDLRHRGP